MAAPPTLLTASPEPTKMPAAVVVPTPRATAPTRLTSPSSPVCTPAPVLLSSSFGRRPVDSRNERNG